MQHTYVCIHACVYACEYIYTHTLIHIYVSMWREMGEEDEEEDKKTGARTNRPDQTLSEMKINGGKQDHGNVEDEGASPAGLIEPVSQASKALSSTSIGQPNTAILTLKHSWQIG